MNLTQQERGILVAHALGGRYEDLIAVVEQMRQDAYLQGRKDFQEEAQDEAASRMTEAAHKLVEMTQANRQQRISVSDDLGHENCSICEAARKRG